MTGHVSSAYKCVAYVVYNGRGESLAPLWYLQELDARVRASQPGHDDALPDKIPDIILAVDEAVYNHIAIDSIKEMANAINQLIASGHPAIAVNPIPFSAVLYPAYSEDPLDIGVPPLTYGIFPPANSQVAVAVKGVPVVAYLLGLGLGIRPVRATIPPSLGVMYPLATGLCGGSRNRKPSLVS